MIETHIMADTQCNQIENEQQHLSDNASGIYAKSNLQQLINNNCSSYMIESKLKQGSRYTQNTINKQYN